MMEVSQLVMTLQEGIVEEASDNEEIPKHVVARTREGKWTHRETSIYVDRSFK